MADANTRAADTCRDTAGIAARAIGWIKDNPDKVRQEQTARTFR